MDKALLDGFPCMEKMEKAVLAIDGKDATKKSSYIFYPKLVVVNSGPGLNTQSLTCIFMQLLLVVVAVQCILFTVVFPRIYTPTPPQGSNVNVKPVVSIYPMSPTEVPVVPTAPAEAPTAPTAGPAPVTAKPAPTNVFKSIAEAKAGWDMNFNLSNPPACKQFFADDIELFYYNQGGMAQYRTYVGWPELYKFMLYLHKVECAERWVNFEKSLIDEKSKILFMVWDYPGTNCLETTETWLYDENFLIKRITAYYNWFVTEPAPQGSPLPARLTPTQNLRPVGATQKGFTSIADAQAAWSKKFNLSNPDVSQQFFADNIELFYYNQGGLRQYRKYVGWPGVYNFMVYLHKVECAERWVNFEKSLVDEASRMIFLVWNYPGTNCLETTETWLYDENFLIERIMAYYNWVVTETAPFGSALHR